MLRREWENNSYSSPYIIPKGPCIIPKGPCNTARTVVLDNFLLMHWSHIRGRLGNYGEECDAVKNSYVIMTVISLGIRFYFLLEYNHKEPINIICLLEL